MYDKKLFDFVNVSNIPDSVFTNQTLMPFRDVKTRLEYLDYLFLLEAYNERMNPFLNPSTVITPTDGTVALNMGYIDPIVISQQGGYPTQFGLAGPTLFNNSSAYVYDYISLISRTNNSTSYNIENIYFNASTPLTSVAMKYAKDWLSTPYKKYLVTELIMGMYSDIKNTTRLAVALSASQLFNYIKVTDYYESNQTSTTSYLNLTNQSGNVGMFYQLSYSYLAGNYYPNGRNYTAVQKDVINTNLNYMNNTVKLIFKVNVSFIDSSTSLQTYSAYICVTCACDVSTGKITIPDNLLDTLKNQSLSLKNLSINTTDYNTSVYMNLQQIMLVMDMNFKSAVDFEWTPTYPD